MDITLSNISWKYCIVFWTYQLLLVLRFLKKIIIHPMLVLALGLLKLSYTVWSWYQAHNCFWAVVYGRCRTNVETGIYLVEGWYYLSSYQIGRVYLIWQIFALCWQKNVAQIEQRDLDGQIKAKSPRIYALKGTSSYLLDQCWMWSLFFTNSPGHWVAKCISLAASPSQLHCVSTCCHCQ